ncbi:MAG: hypothetical protein QM346_20370 [Chloroflexota bacterium]|nr:hypothetical protein [Chloroflexota bacterium]
MPSKGLVRAFVTMLVAGLIWAYAGMGAAWAAPVEEADVVATHSGIECVDGVCTLEVDLGQGTAWLPAGEFRINVNQANLNALPDGAGIEVRNDLVFETPAGEIRLADAKLRLQLDEHNRVDTFAGTAEVPLPSLPLIGKATGQAAAEARVGFERGEALSLADAPLDPGRKYLYFDLASGTALTASAGESRAGELSLAIPQGQRALVVLDPLERFAYIDGHVTLRYNGEMVFLAQLLDPTETVDLFVGELPLRHRATVHVSGLTGAALDDLHLELAGRYAVDAGRMGEWLKLDGEPLAVEGGIVVNGEGLLATGVVRSSLAPERVLDSAVQAQVFVPFSVDYRDAYVELRSRFDSPAAGLHADGVARLDGALDAVADVNVQLPWSERDDAALAEGAGGMKALWDRSIGAVGDATWAGAAQAVNLGRDGYQSAAAGLEWSADLASRQWCAMTGLCESQYGAGPVETAMR